LISGSPKSAYLYGYLAGIQLNQKDYAGAKASSQQDMQLDPSSEDAVQSFSQAEAGLGETDNAIAAWQKWASTHPADAHATLLLGTLEDANGNVEQARQYYKKTLELSPNQPMASNNLAYLMIESGGDADVALSLAQTARRGLPDSTNTADTLAWAYYHAGTYASAKDLLEDATKVDPGNASIHYHLGMTFIKLNEKPDAKVQLAKAASLAPDTQTAKKAALALTQLQ
jgi:Flp pilus assembly protein TadD